jgi:hypothetical protein
VAGIPCARGPLACRKAQGATKKGMGGDPEAGRRPPRKGMGSVRPRGSPRGRALAAALALVTCACAACGASTPGGPPRASAGRASAAQAAHPSGGASRPAASPSGEAGGPEPAAGLPLPADFYGVNYDYQGAAAFAGADAGRLLAALSPGTLRWPGGTEADYFSWTTGRDTEAPRSFSFTLSDLLAAYRATGAPPIFDLNVLAPGNRTNVADQLGMLRAAAALGLPVRYVEIGNELYGGVGRAAFPDGAAYGKTVALYVRALHAAFPGVQVAADACYALTPGCPAGWNGQVLAAAAGSGAPDAMILHTYPGQQYAAFTAALVPGMLAGAYQGAQELQQGVSALQGEPVWVTEYNFRGPYRKGQDVLANPAQTSYARELFVAAYALLLPRIPGIRLVDGWSAFGGGQAYSYWTLPPHPVLTPAGQAVAMVDTAARGAVRWVAATVPGAPQLPGGYPAVLGDGFATPGGEWRAVLVNLGPRAVSLPPAAPWAAGTPYEQVTGTPAASLSAALAPSRGTVPGGGLRLPPYSLTLVGAEIPG